jgi:putative flippase GtrA
VIAARISALSQHTVIRYAFVGGLAFVVDAGTLWLCHGVFGLAIWLATTIAFAAAFVVNFGLNRVLTFAGDGARDGAMHVQTVKFTILVAINFFVTQALMNGLTSKHLGVNYLLAKVLSTGFITLYNFYVYRNWVFGSDSMRPGKREASGDPSSLEHPVGQVRDA